MATPVSIECKNATITDLFTQLANALKNDKPVILEHLDAVTPKSSAMIFLAIQFARGEIDELTLYDPSEAEKPFKVNKTQAPNFDVSGTTDNRKGIPVSIRYRLGLL